MDGDMRQAVVLSMEVYFPNSGSENELRLLVVPGSVGQEDYVEINTHARSLRFDLDELIAKLMRARSKIRDEAPDSPETADLFDEGEAPAAAGAAGRLAGPGERRRRRSVG